jgi:hypothetical protein
MLLSSADANIILDRFNTLPLAGLTTDELELVVRLRRRSVTYAVFVEAAPGNYVLSIKFVRRATGMGLKEAKDLVDTYDIRRDGGVRIPVNLCMAHEEANQLLNSIPDNERHKAWYVLE